MDQALLRMLRLIYVNQVTNVQSGQLNKCHAQQVTTIQVWELLNHHARFAQLARSVNFITLYLVDKPLNKLHVLLASIVRTLVLMQVLPVYQVTFKRIPVSKAALFALLDFTALLVVCRLQSHVQNNSFANQVV